VVLGISNDAPVKNARFHEKQAFNFDLLSDVNLEVSVAYGAASDSGAGKSSRISYIIGVDGKIEKVYAKVKAAEHPAEVLADLE